MAFRQIAGRCLTVVLRRTLVSCRIGSQIRQLSSSSSPLSLSEFVDKEIEAETRSKSPRSSSPASIAGFNVEYSGALVTMTKTSGDKLVEVKFSVSASIDNGMEEEENEESAEQAEMRSRPEFTIDITNTKASGDNVLSFLCSFITDDDGHDGFQIDEFAIHSGKEDPQQKAFSVDCSVLDGELYEHLFEYLETEFGIGSEFATGVVGLATTYEHFCYVDMLKKLKTFARK